MSKYRKIVWNEGMLLTPHHFQQWDNYHEELLNSRVRSVVPFSYGVLELQVNNEAIANANFQITINDYVTDIIRIGLRVRTFPLANSTNPVFAATPAACYVTWLVKYGYNYPKNLTITIDGIECQRKLRTIIQKIIEKKLDRQHRQKWQYE